LGIKGSDLGRHGADLGFPLRQTVHVLDPEFAQNLLQVRRKVAMSIAGSDEFSHTVAERLKLLKLRAAEGCAEGDLQLLNLGMERGTLLVG
jgi:hypothetical protein